MKKISVLGCGMVVLSSLCLSCKSIPPEFIVAQEKQQEGLILLHQRHQQAVHELVQNWYEERINFLNHIKSQEKEKISFIIDNPKGTGSIEVIKKTPFDLIEKHYQEGIATALKIKEALELGYTDSQNWNKILELQKINLELSRSLLEIDLAQRKFYAQLVGKNQPFPSDFINDNIKKLIKQ